MFLSPLLIRCSVFFVVATTWVSMARADEFDAETRLNEIQVVGTHNSYHIEPHSSMLNIIRQATPAEAEAIQYTHRPLSEQFSEFGIRQIELDVFADPKGGHYAQPLGVELVKNADLPPVPDPDPNNELDQPGLKVLHVPDFDYATTVRTFVGALRQIKTWSDANPTHVPIMVLVEVKQDHVSPLFTKPPPFDAAALDSIDAEIQSVFKRSQIITPDSVRGTAASLRVAVTENGWPLLKDVRGKVMFALDNGGAVRDLYLNGHEMLEGRMMFASVATDNPAAAFFKMNDPVGGFKKIQALVKRGFLVRTRADAGTKEARSGDTSRRDRALASGAQFVSTDYPVANKEFSDYSVQIPNGAHRNPVSGR